MKRTFIVELIGMRWVAHIYEEAARMDFVASQIEAGQERLFGFIADDVFKSNRVISSVLDK